MPDTALINDIQSRIFKIRGHFVLLQSDLARLYCVPTRHLLSTIRSFPGEFCFMLDDLEIPPLSEDFATGRRRPFAFTEYGALAVAYAFDTPQAGATALHIVRAFMRLHHGTASAQPPLSFPPQPFEPPEPHLSEAAFASPVRLT